MNILRRFLWITIPVTALTVWLFIAADRHGWLDREFELQFTTDTASNLVVGMPVRISGFRVGRLKSLDLQPSGTVAVRIAVLERYQGFLKSGSRLELSRDQLIGLATLDLYPGESPHLLTPGATIAFDRGAKVGDIAKQVTDRVDPVLTQLQSTLQSLNNRLNDPGLVAAVGSGEQTMGNLNKTMVETQVTLRETRGSVAALQGNVDHLTKELSSLSQKSGVLTEELIGLSQDMRDSWLIRGIFGSKKTKEEKK